MFYVYVLRNKRSDKVYYGYTRDLRRRIAEHNRRSGEWQLVYYESYLSGKDAQARERKLKQYGQSRYQLKQRLKESLKI